MGTRLLLLAISVAACGPVATSDERLPPVLHRLLLNEHDEEITPVTYGHLFHLDAEAMGREMKCVDCHRSLVHVARQYFAYKQYENTYRGLGL